MAIPSVERPPPKLTSHWLAVWRCALKTMQEQGTWEPELRPLLDEYVYALRAAESARNGLTWLDALEVYAEEHAELLPDIAWSVLDRIATGLPTQWDRHAKRAAALADQLALTPRGRKAAGIGREAHAEKPVDPFDALDAEDELAKRRRSNSA